MIRNMTNETKDIGKSTTPMDNSMIRNMKNETKDIANDFAVSLFF